MGRSSQGFAPGVAQERQQQRLTQLERACLDAVGIGNRTWKIASRVMRPTNMVRRLLRRLEGRGLVARDPRYTYPNDIYWVLADGVGLRGPTSTTALDAVPGTNPDQVAPTPNGGEEAMSGLTKAQRDVLASAAGHAKGLIYAQGSRITSCRKLRDFGYLVFEGFGSTTMIYAITPAGREALSRAEEKGS